MTIAPSHLLHNLNQGIQLVLARCLGFPQFSYARSALFHAVSNGKRHVDKLGDRFLMFLKPGLVLGFHLHYESHGLFNSHPQIQQQLFPATRLGHQ